MILNPLLPNPLKMGRRGHITTLAANISRDKPFQTVAVLTDIAMVYIYMYQEGPCAGTCIWCTTVVQKPHKMCILLHFLCTGELWYHETGLHWWEKISISHVGSTLDHSMN